MKLIVVRHGQSYMNVDDWQELDTMDTSLTDLGKQQAIALRDWLIKQKPTVDVLYASTMRRTRETAQYVGEGINLEPIFDDRLREFGNSHHDGRPVKEEELPRAYTHLRTTEEPFAATVTDVDNAESWMHFRIRIGRFIHEMYEKHPNQTIYIVAHAGVISAIFDLVFNVGAYKQSGVMTENTGWTRFEYHPDESFADWILYDHNRVDHLVQTGLL